MHTLSRPQVEQFEPRRFLDGSVTSILNPTVLGAEFIFQTAPHKLQIQFSSNVSLSLTAADLLVQNHTTLHRVPTAAITRLSYDTATNTATFALTPRGALADGNYRLRIAKGDVTDPLGNPMAEDFIFDFFVFSADADRNRVIDINDFGRLAANFGQPANFEAGDFDYSGIVELPDFVLLASRFNTSLAALQPTQVRYQIQVLPAPSSAYGNTVVPSAINDLGAVVVTNTASTGVGSNSNSNGHIWQPGAAQLTPLIETSHPSDLSNTGFYCGSIYTSNNMFTRATLNGQILGGLGPVNFTIRNVATAVNDLGQSVGFDYANQKGLRWLTGPGSLEVLGNVFLSDINNSGEIAGRATGGATGALFYPAGEAPITIGPGHAAALNNNGQVVGTTTINDGGPFVWDSQVGGDPFLLEAPAGMEANAGAPAAINNSGVVVGNWGSSFYNNQVPIVWHQGMGYNVNDLLVSAPTGLRIVGVADINSSGQIIAWGNNPGGSSQGTSVWAILLTPVPSTSTASRQHPTPADHLPSAAAMPAVANRQLAFFSERVVDQLLISSDANATELAVA